MRITHLASKMSPVTYDPRFPLCWALDFNVDPLCSVIFQIRDLDTQPALGGPRVAIIRVLDEIVLTNSNTVEAAKEFIRRTLPWCGCQDETGWEGINVTLLLNVTIYGDASGNSRTTKSTRTDYELIREVFRQNSQYQINLKTNTSNPAIKDRVNAVNAQLCTVSGKRRLFVDPKCRELIRDFQQVKWKRDSAGNPTGALDNSDWQRTHTSDALSYAVMKEFGLKRVVYGELSKSPF